jgi:cell division septum initiation protein DivIVA
MRQEIEKLENELQLLEYNLSKGDQLETILQRTFQTMEDVANVREMTNAQLHQIIRKIEVDAQGNVDIFLRLLGDLGLDETVLVSDDSMYRRL